MGKLRQLFITLSLLTILTTVAFAQTTLTQIRDTITNTNGTPFNGTLAITWMGFSTSSSGSLSPLSTSARIYNGALSVLLVPSTTAAAGSFYQVVYSSTDGTTTWTETWSVPPSTTALTVSAVRTSSTSGTSTTTTGSSSGGTSTGSTSSSYATLPISISEVTGLAADLNTINTAITNLQSAVSGGSTTSSSSLSALTTQVNALTTTVGGLSTTTGSLSTSVATNTSNISALSTSVTNIGSTVATLSSTVAALQTASSTVVSGSGGTISVAFIDGETPSGTLNGTNAVFTLSQSPTPAGSLELYRNGLVQTSGVDYGITGQTITFSSGGIPVAGDILQAYYRVTGSSSMPTFADDEVPAGSINGSNLTFTLAYTPSPAVSLKLYKNGMLLQQHSDYTLSGSSIIFVSASTPQAGDSITAYYRH